MEASCPMDMPSLELVFEDKLGERHAAEVRCLLESCGDGFVPPLSTRTSTHQTDLRSIGEQGTQPGGYFSELWRQPFVLALSEGRVVAFLSYIVDYPVECGGGRLLTTYVTTICVDPGFRRRGIATALYRLLERRADSRCLSVRTWSTNVAQMTLLQALGYQELVRIHDDRGRGIDTVYYLKEPFGNAL